MNNWFKVITLCGSVKFKEEFINIQNKLTLEGNLVISTEFLDDIITDDIKKMLDKIHRQKIEIADEIFVININGYIGESTKNEIEYAKSKGKIINYLINIENN
jgi:hypothetical protein